MMAVGGGTGSTISFSTIRDFYGDTNPVVFSDFERKSSNDGLVDATFAGASTATSTSGNATKNDFGVTTSTATVYTGTLGTLTSRVNTSVSNTSSGSTISDTYTVLASDSVLVLGGGGQNHQSGADGDGVDLVGSWSTSGIINISPVASGQAKFYTGPAYQSGDSSDLTFSGSISAGTFTITSSVGTAGGGVSVSTRRRNPVTIHDVTFTNNNNTGDTYTLASSSTRLDSTDASQLVYAAGTTRQVKDDSTSGQWTIAYDNVTGSGSGTAGDIGVTVASGSGITASVTSSGGGSPTTVTAPSGALSYTNVFAHTQTNDGNVNCKIFRNYHLGGSNEIAVASGFGEGSATATYTGTIVAGDIFRVSGGNQVNNITINYKNPDKVITYQNNGSSSITLGSSSTGGARTIAAGASAIVQSTGSTNNESWAVHFNTSSGDCNVGIPATIGAGNPVNLNLFNTVTTPVG